MVKLIQLGVVAERSEVAVLVSRHDTSMIANQDTGMRFKATTAGLKPLKFAKCSALFHKVNYT
jgi:hypothetical protein